MDDDTKQKQLFLRKKIIEQGYDPLPFTEYLSQQRENGHDIETWSLKDLQDIVNKYIEISPKPVITGPIPPEHSASEVDESNDEEDKPPKKIQKDSPKDSDREIKDISPSEKTSVSSPISILRLCRN